METKAVLPSSEIW